MQDATPPNDPKTNAPPSGSARAAVEQPGASGSTALWLIVGAVIAALVIFWLLAGGADEAVDAVDDPAVVTDDAPAVITDEEVLVVPEAAPEPVNE